MPKPKVFVTRRIPEVATEILAAQCELEIFPGDLPPSRAELLAGVQGCSGILSLLSDRIDGEVLDAAGPQLKVVSNFAVGYNNIDVLELTRRGVAVGNTPDVLTDATADIAVALMLAIARRLPESQLAVRVGDWKTWEPLGWLGLDLQGKTLGIIGMGRIGEAVARRMCGGWNMRLLYTARSDKPQMDARFNARRQSLEHVLEESDFVSVHVALNDETRHLIGAEQLHRMRKTAVLVNTSRGEVIDQEALVQALGEGRIHGAGLDVCTPEPLPTDHPLLRLKNCIVLPHIGSATYQARNAMAERAARNIVAGIQGHSLPHPVFPT